MNRIQGKDCKIVAYEISEVSLSYFDDMMNIMD